MGREHLRATSVPRLGAGSGETLTAFDNGVPMYVCTDANGGLGSSTSKRFGSLNADQETPNGE